MTTKVGSSGSISKHVKMNSEHRGERTKTSWKVSMEKDSPWWGFRRREEGQGWDISQMILSS